MTQIPLTILLDDGASADMPAVVARLRDAGLVVDRVLAAAGVVSGRAASDAVAKLESVDGVAAVQPDREMHIAPPESELQ